MKKSIIGLSFCALMFIGCTPLYYVPNALNTPLIHEQGEISLTGTANNEQFDAQLAVCFKENWVLQTNYFELVNKGTNYGNGNIKEVGVGYATPFSKHLFFEIYGLGAAGSVKNSFEDEGLLLANFNRIAVQPSIAYKRKRFEFILSCRAGQISYYDVNGTLIFEQTDHVNLLRNNPTTFFVEPAATIRLGIKNVKLQGQIIIGTNLNNQNIARFQDFTNGSLGLFIDFNLSNIQKFKQIKS